MNAAWMWLVHRLRWIDSLDTWLIRHSRRFRAWRIAGDEERRRKENQRLSRGE